MIPLQSQTVYFILQAPEYQKHACGNATNATFVTESGKQDKKRQTYFGTNN